MDYELVDVTLSHGGLAPYLFPSVRDVKLPGVLFFAIDIHNPGDALAAAYLASPSPGERSEFVMDYLLFRPDPDGLLLQFLLPALITLAVTHRAPSLRLMKAVTSADEARHLEDAGFYVELESIDFRIATQQALDYVCTHFTSRSLKRVPEDIEVVDYNDRRQDQISRLCAQEFGAMTQGHLGALGQLNDDRDYSCSTAVYWQDELVCSLGTGIDNGLAIFDPLLIALKQRDSWAFPFIVEQVLAKVIAKGAANAKVVVHGSNNKMIQFMTRMGSKIEGRLRSYKIHLGTESGHGA